MSAPQGHSSLSQSAVGSHSHSIDWNMIDNEVRAILSPHFTKLNLDKMDTSEVFS